MTNGESLQPRLAVFSVAWNCQSPAFAQQSGRPGSVLRRVAPVAFQSSLSKPLVLLSGLATLALAFLLLFVTNRSRFTCHWRRLECLLP